MAGRDRPWRVDRSRRDAGDRRGVRRRRRCASSGLIGVAVGGSGRRTVTRPREATGGWRTRSADPPSGGSNDRRADVTDRDAADVPFERTVPRRSWPASASPSALRISAGRVPPARRLAAGYDPDDDLGPWPASSAVSTPSRRERPSLGCHRGASVRSGRSNPWRPRLMACLIAACSASGSSIAVLRPSTFCHQAIVAGNGLRRPARPMRPGAGRRRPRARRLVAAHEGRTHTGLRSPGSRGRPLPGAGRGRGYDGQRSSGSIFGTLLVPFAPYPRRRETVGPRIR